MKFGRAEQRGDRAFAVVALRERSLQVRLLSGGASCASGLAIRVPLCRRREHGARPHGRAIRPLGLELIDLKFGREAQRGDRAFAVVALRERLCQAHRLSGGASLSCKATARGDQGTHRELA